MRTGQTKNAPRYFCKVPLNNPAKRLIWWAFRRWLLNEDHYQLVTRYTGPRARMAYSTKKADATAHRYYLERRPQYRPKRYPAAWRDIPATQPPVRPVSRITDMDRSYQ